MADEAPPTAQPEDFGGPPHVQQVSQTLQYWIIPAGILIFLSIGSVRLVHTYVRTTGLLSAPRVAFSPSSLFDLQADGTTEFAQQEEEEGEKG